MELALAELQPTLDDKFDIGTLLDSPHRVSFKSPSPSPALEAEPWADTKALSDIIFIVGGQRFHAHKEVLAQRSGYFHRQLAELAHVSSLDVEIEIRDCTADIFRMTLGFLYTNKININADNAWTIYQLSELYEIRDLTDLSTDYIMSFATPENVWELHRMAAELGATPIVERCHILAQNIFKATAAAQAQANNRAPRYADDANGASGGGGGGAVHPQRLSAGYPSSFTAPVQRNHEFNPSFQTMQFALDHVVPQQHQHVPTSGSGGSVKLLPPSPSSRIKLPESPPDAFEPPERGELEWCLDRLSELVSIAKTIVEADRTSLFLFDETTNELCAMLNSTCEIRFPHNTGIAGTCFTSGKMINCKDTSSDPRFLVDVDKQTGYRTRSILCMPIILPGGRVSGVLEVLNKLQKPGSNARAVFTEKDEEMMDHTCKLAGGLLARIPSHIHSIKMQPERRQMLVPEVEGVTIHPYKRAKRKNSIPIFHFKVPVAH